MSAGIGTRRWAPRVGLLMALALAFSFATDAAPPSAAAGGKPPVEALFADWRAFETPPSLQGAPDYRASTFERRRAELARLRGR